MRYREPNRTLYIVHMRRWGDEESHSYIHGVYSTKEQAETAGNKERYWRDNKYEPKITTHVLDYCRHEVK